MSIITQAWSRLTLSRAESRSQVALEYASLLALTFAAALLRFYKLGAWGFWGDEMYTIRDAFAAVNEPGLHSVSFTLTGLAISNLGITEWSARLVSALIGIVSIPLLYFPFKKMFGPMVSLAIGLLLAISPWHLYWSQNARFYTALLLFYSLALCLFYFALEEDRPFYLLLSFVFAGLAFQERLTGLLFVPVAGAYLLSFYLLPRFGIKIERPSGLRWRNLLILAIPTIAGAIYFIVPELLTWPRWVEAFGRINNNPLWIVAGVIYYVRIPVIVMGVAGMAYLWFQKPSFQRAGLLLGISALLPLIAIAGISLVHYTANRYVFVSLTSWLALTSVALVALMREIGGRSKGSLSAHFLVLGVVAVLILDPLSENFLYYRYQNGNRDDWKGALTYVQNNLAPGEMVISGHHLVSNYYLGRETVDIYTLEIDDLEGLQGRTWIVEDMNVPERRPEIHQWLIEHAQLVASFDVHVKARNFMMRVYMYMPGEEIYPVFIR